jgi:hypothetical protein
VPCSKRPTPDRERVLGADHPHTLTSRNNLAGAYRPTGRLGEAIGLCQQALANAERVLGEDHPLTQTIRSSHTTAQNRQRHADLPAATIAQLTSSANQLERGA